MARESAIDKILSYLEKMLQELNMRCKIGYAVGDNYDDVARFKICERIRKYVLNLKGGK